MNTPLCHTTAQRVRLYCTVPILSPFAAAYSLHILCCAVLFWTVHCYVHCTVHCRSSFYRHELHPSRVYITVTTLAYGESSLLCSFSSITKNVCFGFKLHSYSDSRPANNANLCLCAFLARNELNRNESKWNSFGSREASRSARPRIATSSVLYSESGLYAVAAARTSIFSHLLEPGTNCVPMPSHTQSMPRLASPSLTLTLTRMHAAEARLLKIFLLIALHCTCTVQLRVHFCTLHLHSE